MALHQLPEQELEMLTIVYMKLLISVISDKPIPIDILDLSNEAIKDLENINIGRMEDNYFYISEKGKQEVILFFHNEALLQRLNNDFFKHLASHNADIVGPILAVFFAYNAQEIQDKNLRNLLKNNRNLEFTEQDIAIVVDFFSKIPTIGKQYDVSLLQAYTEQYPHTIAVVLNVLLRYTLVKIIGITQLDK